jgi:HlyD family secretion protein
MFARVLMVEAAGKQWLSFNVREDHLSGLTIGETVSVMRNGAGGAIKAAITELRPLGKFATWQAERVIGDHDRNTLRLRLDPKGEPADLEPGNDCLDRELARTRAPKNRFGR